MQQECKHDNKVQQNQTSHPLIKHWVIYRFRQVPCCLDTIANPYAHKSSVPMAIFACSIWYEEASSNSVVYHLGQTFEYARFDEGAMTTSKMPSITTTPRITESTFLLIPDTNSIAIIIAKKIYPYKISLNNNGIDTIPVTTASDISVLRGLSTSFRFICTQKTNTKIRTQT